MNGCIFPHCQCKAIAIANNRSKTLPTNYPCLAGVDDTRAQAMIRMAERNGYGCASPIQHQTPDEIQIALDNYLATVGEETLIPGRTYDVRPMSLHIISRGEGWITANYEGCKPFVEKEEKFRSRLVQ